MRELILEDVRCFHERQCVPLRPLTLLVGENSSGKSTVLSLVRVAHDLCRGEQQVDFNEEPFALGSYDQIACLRGGRGGLAKSFTIGGGLAIGRPTSRAASDDQREVTVEGRFIRSGAQPVLSSLLVHAREYRMEVHYRPDLRLDHLALAFPSGSARLPADVLRYPVAARVPHIMSFLPLMLSSELLRSKKEQVDGTLPQDHELDAFRKLALRIEAATKARPYAFAPIRTRPRRTYDPLSEEPAPEGSHVPMLLARHQSSSSTEWEGLRASLCSFGQASSLFRDVDVRRLGTKPSDPFQVIIRIIGPAFNLVDVGYGVSQILPIIVDALRAERGSTLLIQQPEVHLHPKAQAELGTLLGTLAKTNGVKFVVETHSDHLLDRVRMDVRDKRHVGPDDVALLYLFRERGMARVRELHLDESGRLLDAPRGYRQFFLDEEKRLLEA